MNTFFSLYVENIKLLCPQTYLKYGRYTNICDNSKWLKCSYDTWNEERWLYRVMHVKVHSYSTNIIRFTSTFTQNFNFKNAVFCRTYLFLNFSTSNFKDMLLIIRGKAHNCSTYIISIIILFRQIYLKVQKILVHSSLSTTA
jgi:hypothetical protein